MTASAVATPLGRASLLTRIASAVRARSIEALVFSAAAALALLHAFDDAFLLPSGGLPVTQHALAFGIALVASVVGAVKFDSLRPGVRAALAFAFGVLAVVNGGRHVHHIINEGMTANDATGALALAAGVVFVGLAAWIPFRHRGEGASGPVRRWAILVLLLPVAYLAVSFFFLQDGQLHRLRRRRPRGLVPPVAERRIGAHDLGRRRQPPQHLAPRQDARPQRLRRARLRPARLR